MKQLLDCNIDFCTLKSRCSFFFGGSGSCLIKEDLFEYTRGPFFRCMFAFSGMQLLHNLTCSTTCKSLPGERESLKLNGKLYLFLMNTCNRQYLRFITSKNTWRVATLLQGYTSEMAKVCHVSNLMTISFAPPMPPDSWFLLWWIHVAGWTPYETVHWGYQFLQKNHRISFVNLNWYRNWMPCS